MPRQSAIQRFVAAEKAYTLYEFDLSREAELIEPTALPAALPALPASPEKSGLSSPSGLQKAALELKEAALACVEPMIADLDAQCTNWPDSLLETLADLDVSMRSMRSMPSSCAALWNAACRVGPPRPHKETALQAPNALAARIIRAFLSAKPPAHLIGIQFAERQTRMLQLTGVKPRIAYKRDDTRGLLSHALSRATRAYDDFDRCNLSILLEILKDPPTHFLNSTTNFGTSEGTTDSDDAGSKLPGLRFSSSTASIIAEAFKDHIFPEDLRELKAFPLLAMIFEQAHCEEYSDSESFLNKTHASASSKSKRPRTEDTIESAAAAEEFFFRRFN